VYEYTNNYSINEDILHATSQTQTQENADGTKDGTKEKITKTFLYKDPRESKVDTNTWLNPYPSNARPPKAG